MYVPCSPSALAYLSQFGDIDTSIRMAQWLRLPSLDQQVDLKGLDSNPGASKLDSSFQLSVK
jgi:hypothetical protein